MKTTAMLIALCMGILLSCAEQEINPTQPQHEKYIGTWLNDEAETGTISRVSIQMDNADQATIRVSSYCDDLECDWGALHISSTLLESSDFEVIWVTDYTSINQRFEYQSGSLRAITTTTYTDDSSRPEVVTEDIFKLDLTSSGGKKSLKRY